MFDKSKKADILYIRGFYKKGSVMARRYELTDSQWELIKDMLPEMSGRGRPWTEHRKVVNGLFWILNSGAPWRDLPERYGAWETVYYRFYRWQQDGTFDVILEKLQVILDEHGYIDWELWCVDGTSIRAHKSAAGAGKKGALKSPKTMPWAALGVVGDPRSIWYLTEEESLSLQKSLPDKRTKPEVLKT